MTNQFNQHMTKINATLTMFEQDPISLLSATVMEQLAIGDSSSEPQPRLQVAPLSSPLPHRPTPRWTAQQVVGLRALDGGVATCPPRVICPPKYPRGTRDPPTKSKRTIFQTRRILYLRSSIFFKPMKASGSVAKATL